MERQRERNLYLYFFDHFVIEVFINDNLITPNIQELIQELIQTHLINRHASFYCTRLKLTLTFVELILYFHEVQLLMQSLSFSHSPKGYGYQYSFIQESMPHDIWDNVTIQNFGYLKCRLISLNHLIKGVCYVFLNNRDPTTKQQR